MFEYYFTLAGLNVLLRAPWKIEIARRLQPFLCAERENIHCVITVQAEDCLYSLQGQGTWHGPEFYRHLGTTMDVFHCNHAEGEAFAVTQLKEMGEITLLVKKGYEHSFYTTAGIFNRIGFEAFLLQHQGLLLHASLIKFENKAIAFTGPSGIGKSTQADLWEKCLGAFIINGDRAALRNTTSGWQAYGSPYAGTSDIYVNDSAPLEAIVVLEQGKENSLAPLSATQALQHIYPQLSMLRWDKAFTEKATDLCLQLIEKVPVYKLKCLPNEDAVTLLKRGLLL